MGRQYRDELTELAATSSGAGMPPLQLARAISASGAQPLIVVASGGAQVAAHWLAHLHLAVFGRPVSVQTPLEFLSQTSFCDCAVWLVSQGGQHADIISAAHWAVDNTPLTTYTLVGRADSPLAELVDARGGLSCCLSMGSGVDGFLATNGLWAMLCALTRAYLPQWGLPNSPAIDDALVAIILGWAKHAAETVSDIAFRPSYAVIADPWTMIGARDLEIRATEASLGQVWVADYRNLGHGRHFWLADRADDTSLLLLASQGYEALDRWTRADLPDGLEQIPISVPFTGPIAGLASVAFSMQLAGRLGHHLNRDPGRPGVPLFGERLYAGDVERPQTSRAAVTLAQGAVVHKLGVDPIQVDEHEYGYWFDAWHAYRKSLHQRMIQAVVFDFDGTLVFSHHRWGGIPSELAAQLRRLLDHGLYVGIATGRGDSVQKILRRAFEGSDLSRVLVGYHNGATVRALEASAADLDGDCDHRLLLQAGAALRAQLGHAAEIQMRAHQCSLKPTKAQTLRDLWFQVRDVLDQQSDTASLRAWLSSHSVDICAPGASKLNVISHLTGELYLRDDAILRMGDRGAWPGNDYELLDHPCGLSVDQCSLNPLHCWNLTGGAAPGPEGVVSVLRRLVLSAETGSAWIDLEGES